MIALDSSVVIAGFASWHTHHATAHPVLAERPAVLGHALLEAYSVLTRLPAPHRSPADVVSEFLDSQFPDAPLLLGPDEHRDLLRSLPRRGITGGAVYDALIAATAASHDAVLVTLDTRASTTYERVGCQVRLLA